MTHERDEADEPPEPIAAIQTKPSAHHWLTPPEERWPAQGGDDEC